MNKRQAEREGYTFTGHYSSNKEEMKIAAKEERAKGNKAITVTVPHSKYSRSSFGGCGYSVYIIKSEANKQAEKQASIDSKLERLENKKIQLFEELAKIDAEIVETKMEVI